MKKPLSLSYRSMSAGFRAAGVRSSQQLDLDPFLNVDLFHMSVPTFPPHPHAGFSAVTYLLPESEGSFVNRDSLGDRTPISPGDIHWTQAGSGMMHEEVPATSGTDCWGFQIFVDMRDKHRAPAAFHAESGTIPVVRGGGSEVRVVVGAYDERSSPLRDLATPVTMLDITLAPSARMSVQVVEGHRAFAFGILGEVTYGEDALTGPGVLPFRDGARRVELSAGATGAWRGLFCSGEPLRQPVVWGGPFAMTTVEQVEAAQRRYRQGGMGKLSPSF